MREVARSRCAQCKGEERVALPHPLCTPPDMTHLYPLLYPLRFRRPKTKREANHHPVGLPLAQLFTQKCSLLRISPVVSSQRNTSWAASSSKLVVTHKNDGMVWLQSPTASSTAGRAPSNIKISR